MIHSLLLLSSNNIHKCQRTASILLPHTIMTRRYNSRASRLTTALLMLSSSQQPCCAFSSPSFFASAHQLRAGALRSVSTKDIIAETTSTMVNDATAAGPKLDALRSAMDELELDVYLVPSDDPHLSEYTPDAYKRRAFLSDFHGSAGTAVVTREEAFLWTDSR